MLVSQIISLRMDRPIDRENHYISAGGYTVRTVDDEEITYDFRNSVSYFVNEEKEEITFDLWGLDVDAFPDSKKLTPKNIKEIKEMHIFTGEENEPKLNVTDICQLVLFFEKGDELEALCLKNKITNKLSIDFSITT